MTETRRPKVLVIGDAVAPTGFARVLHNVCETVKDWADIAVLGVNYRGDPHKYPYQIFPAHMGGDVFGIGRTKALCETLKPDIVLINSDPWITADHLERVPAGIPVVAYMPVDAPNQGHAMRLNDLTLAVAYTKFGKKELMLGGYVGRTEVVPHGVDLELYRQPATRAQGRSRLRDPRLREVDQDRLFIVGNVNRNQPRKRLDLTIRYWAEWWRRAGCPRDAFLYLHCAARAEGGWDIPQLAEYYGIETQLLMTSRNMTSEMAAKEHEMHVIYGVFDAQISTTLGEGWGLTTMEGMACGVPQIVPEYSALGEWPRGAVTYLPITDYINMWDDLNTTGGVVGMEGAVEAIEAHCRSKALRADMAARGRALVERPEFRWDAIGRRFVDILQGVLAEQRAKAAAAEARTA